MRIRTIKPEFWKDSRLADLSEGARLFFVGTWQLADDAGWLRWDVATIAAELYPFEGRAAREKRVRRHADALGKLDRLRIEDCGHALVPRMPSHQHLAGTTRRVHTIRDEHTRECLAPRLPATARDNPRLPASERKGSEGFGSALTREESGPSSVLDAARIAIARHESGEEPLNPAVLEKLRATVERHQKEAK